MTTPKQRRDAALDESGWAINWAYGGGKQAFVPELDGRNALLKFQKMRRVDETIGAMFWVMTSTICQLPWGFQPCVDGVEVSSDDKDYDQALKWAQFAESCLHDMSHSWVDHLEEALTMAWAGFAPCEIVFKKRDGEQSRYDDGKWGFKALPLRDQLTIWNFTVDARNELELMQQRTYDGKSADTPLWKVLHYRMGRVLNDPWGVSMLENAYRPWYLKQRIQESEAIGIDRELCGMPTFRIPNDELKTAAKTDGAGAPTAEAAAARQRINAAVNAVTKLRFNEVGGLILPSDVYLDDDGKPSSMRKWDFSLITSTGQRAIDARTAARDYDRAVARTVLMQFLHLGDRSGGSYGLSSDQSSMAIRSMAAIAGKIAGEFNLKAVPLLWLVNAAPNKFIPKMEAGKLSEESIEKLGQFIADIALAQPLFDQDPALRDAVYERAGLQAPRRKLRPVPAKPAQDDLTPKPQPANVNGQQPARSAAKPAGRKG